MKKNTLRWFILLLVTFLGFVTVIHKTHAEVVGVKGYVTGYSSIDSCSTAKCIMFSGKSAYIGAVACPRKYKIGTKVKINGKVYKCEDRTAKWIEKKYPNTFDIFMGYTKESHRRALVWGRQKLYIEIIN